MHVRSAESEMPDPTSTTFCSENQRLTRRHAASACLSGLLRCVLGTACPASTCGLTPLILWRRDIGTVLPPHQRLKSVLGDPGPAADKATHQYQPASYTPPRCTGITDTIRTSCSSVLTAPISAAPALCATNRARPSPFRPVKTASRRCGEDRALLTDRLPVQWRKRTAISASLLTQWFPADTSYLATTSWLATKENMALNRLSTVRHPSVDGCRRLALNRLSTVRHPLG